MLILLILALVVLFIVLYLIPVKVVIDFKRQKDKDHFEIKVSSLFFNHKLQLSYIDLKSLFYPYFIIKGNLIGLLEKDILIEEELNEEELRKVINHLRKMEEIIKQVEPLSFFTNHCSYLSWQTSFGLTNPAFTGMLSGGLWALKGAIIGFFRNFLRFSTAPLIEVNPNFNNVESLRVEFKGIFKFRLGNIILMGSRIVFYDLKRRLKYGRSSN
ncbi:Protein of unknown function (DUF2953) [Halobacteroides halobius DSM 5150]|uniref:DUF2953 domain-containing protein n=1 Tax=Halobacteroides halobius (strain ATCC 35273 / DSM 5150 / MD-1) TaxID=748449 RepID=L0K8Y9_HALHC|nr:DUF2953 domain-containing protein [Halobacteroides halobius]AGB40588.1 Protein of unknown function (DUF2953) [Halobacteroides halobius DSM 5150]